MLPIHAEAVHMHTQLTSKIPTTVWDATIKTTVFTVV